MECSHEKEAGYRQKNESTKKKQRNELYRSKPQLAKLQTIKFQHFDASVSCLKGGEEGGVTRGLCLWVVVVVCLVAPPPQSKTPFFPEIKIKGETQPHQADKTARTTPYPPYPSSRT